jgi:hypothetical protein
MSDSNQYKAQLEEYTEGQDPLVMQSNTPRLLAKLIEEVPQQELQRRPSPDKWSVAEILAHLAEDEVASAWRYRQMLENSGCVLSAFDQDEWARRGDYASWKPADSLQLFRLLREANLRLLEKLKPEEWMRHGVHAERGKITIKDLARHMARHDINHVDQIRTILGRT